jgi:phosphatidylserine decarboxylase
MGNGMKLPPIHREGWPFIAAFAVLTAILFAFVGPLGWLGVLMTAWCVYFFRDPPRVTPSREGMVIAPADGVVLPLAEAAPPAELEMGEAPRTRISVFMNVFDVHVNRAPIDGTVVATAYRPGRFFNASFDKASEHNERMAARLRLPDGDGDGDNDLAVVQIAGLVARRIKSELAQGQAVRAGDRFGIIRFGSRVDVYLPSGFTPMVIAGQRSVAGETVLADARAQEPQRRGEVK